MRLILSLLMVLGVGCSSAQKLTKYSSPVMRIMVDPDVVQGNDYDAIVSILVESGKWIVVDRASGFRAAVKEQNRQHRGEDRFDDDEKYAMVQKLFGVGGIIVAKESCPMYNGFTGVFYICTQIVSLINASTGEVISSVKNLHEAYRFSEWDETVNKFNQNFPKSYSDPHYDASLLTYRKLAKQHASEQRKIRKSDADQEGSPDEDEQAAIHFYDAQSK